VNIADIAQAIRAKEAMYDQQIAEDQWIVVRLDGRGFSSLTEQHFTKPFDGDFHALMLHTAQELFALFEGAYCYTGSDEISLVLPPKWGMFDRRISKIISISASIAASTFTQAFHKRAQFDSRVVAFSSLDEVVQYCSWRVADVRRCAIHTAIYWTLKHSGMSATKVTKLLNGMPWQEKDKMLQEQFSIKFSEIALWKQQGIGIHWETYEKTGYNPIKNIEAIAERRRTKVVDVVRGEYYEQYLLKLLQGEAS